MSENKRFNAVINEDHEIEYIQDLQAYEDLDFAEFMEIANSLAGENENLKKALWDAETKADYCHLLNELDNKDLSFIHDCIKAINKCDLMGMTQLIREC